MPIQRGEIYFVDLSPTQGREQSGKRPVLVLSIDEINRLPLVVTVIVGTKGDNITNDYQLISVFPLLKVDYRWKLCSWGFKFAR